MKVAAISNFPDVAKQIAALGTKVYQQAAVRAMNDVVNKAKTSMSRKIRREFSMDASRVNAALRINRASASQGLSRIEASIESPQRRGRSRNVINFQARQVKAGVTVRIKRGGGRKLIRGAFIGNKGRTVFVREGTKRLPIKGVQTLDVQQMFNTRRISSTVKKMMQAEFPKQFARHAKWYSSK